MPQSIVRNFTDPDAFHAAIEDTHAEGIITERGDFRAELTGIRLPQLSLQRGKESLARVASSAVDPRLFGFVFLTGPGAP